MLRQPLGSRSGRRKVVSGGAVMGQAHWRSARHSGRTRWQTEFEG